MSRVLLHQLIHTSNVFEVATLTLVPLNIMCFEVQTAFYWILPSVLDLDHHWPEHSAALQGISDVYRPQLLGRGRTS